MEFRDWLRGHMEARRLRQSQLATYAGVSQGAVSEWLKGTRRPRPELLRRLAHPLGVTEHEVMAAAGYLDGAVTTAERPRRHPDMEAILDTLTWDAQAAIAEAIRLMADGIRHSADIGQRNVGSGVGAVMPGIDGANSPGKDGEPHLGDSLDRPTTDPDDTPSRQAERILDVLGRDALSDKERGS